VRKFLAHSQRFAQGGKSASSVATQPFNETSFLCLLRSASKKKNEKTIFAQKVFCKKRLALQKFFLFFLAAEKTCRQKFLFFKTFGGKKGGRGTRLTVLYTVVTAPPATKVREEKRLNPTAKRKTLQGAQPCREPSMYK